MRIGGLASGMDIDAIVKQLMTAKKVPLNKLNQQKEQTEWKREGYRQVSTNLVSFNQKLSTYSLSSSIDSKKATVTGAPNVLTATANGAATNSVLNISVTELASATNISSKELSPKNAGIAASQSISDIYSGSQTSISIGNGIDTPSIITFSSTDTIQSLINKINNNTTAGVTAVYDSNSGRMSLTRKETGDKDIELSGELLDIGFEFNDPNVVQGTDASVIINGITTTQASNRFTINGVEISITGKSPVGQTTQIEVSKDLDKMVETIKAFVDTYNSTLATLNQKTSEERFRSYLPLTSEQRAAMKEDEIKLWESKAKSGLLKNDSIIDQTLSSMRSAMISGVNTGQTIQVEKDGVMVTEKVTVNMTQFGITTGNYSEKGKLYIDETKLRTALENNPEGAVTLFGKTDSSNKNYTADDGLFSRIRKINSTSLTQLSDKAGTSRYSSDLTTSFLPQSQIGEQIRTFDSRITDLQNRLTMIENQYYKQFTMMETAMNKYNSASSSLFSMLS